MSITNEEWNKLSREQQIGNVRMYIKRYNELEESGAPIDRGELVRLARENNTPVPEIDDKGEFSFTGEHSFK